MSKFNVKIHVSNECGISNETIDFSIFDISNANVNSLIDDIKNFNTANPCPNFINILHDKWISDYKHSEDSWHKSEIAHGIPCGWTADIYVYNSETNECITCGDADMPAKHV